jgi:5'-methylthioadenosine phosphorylase
LGVIAGSGLHGHSVVAEPTNIELTVTGAGGDDTVVDIDDCGDFLLLRRHRGHTSIPAHLVDHHAHIRALCEAGCNRVLALSSVGSLRTDWGIGTIVIPDDFLAFDAYPTFYDDTRGHGVPGFDPEWRHQVIEAWKRATGSTPEDGGVYAQTRGPRFETPAEVRVLAQHADLVGMTIASEAVLAREAGLAYAAVCKVDNLGNGLGTEPLTVEEYRTNTIATLDAFVDAVLATITELTA